MFSVHKRTSFVLNKKNKDIKKSTEEISKNDDKVSENGMVVERITKSKFTTDLLSQFIEHKKGNFISCMEYDLENSIFEKLKDTENKLTKEEVHSFLEEFIKGRKHKVTVIK